MMDDLRAWAPLVSLLVASLALWFARSDRGEAKREKEREAKDSELRVQIAECQRRVGAAFEKIDQNRAACDTIRHDLAAEIAKAERDITREATARERDSMTSLSGIAAQLSALTATLAAMRQKGHGE